MITNECWKLGHQNQLTKAATIIRKIKKCMTFNNTFKFKSLWGSVRGSLLIRPLTGALCWTVDASSDVVSSRFRSLLSISLSCWWCSCCRIFSICVPSNNSTPLLPHPLPCRYYRPTNDLCSPTRCRKRALTSRESRCDLYFLFSQIVNR